MQKDTSCPRRRAPKTPGGEQDQDWLGSRLRGNDVADEEPTLRQPTISRFMRSIAKAPIHLYRWTLKAFVGFHCRHEPSCSEYGLTAIDRNGAWRGSWLTLARICRCHPWGSSGYDPVPDIRAEHHPLAPWRYGRWKKPETP